MSRRLSGSKVDALVQITEVTRFPSSAELTVTVASDN